MAGSSAVAVVSDAEASAASEAPPVDAEASAASETPDKQKEDEQHPVLSKQVEMTMSEDMRRDIFKRQKVYPLQSLHITIAAQHHRYKFSFSAC